MPVLVNDWDSKRRRPIVAYAVTCTRCGKAEKADTPAVPKGWEEAMAPVDGRFPAACPDCLRN